MLMCDFTIIGILLLHQVTSKRSLTHNHFPGQRRVIQLVKIYLSELSLKARAKPGFFLGGGGHVSIENTFLRTLSNSYLLII
jgi:hypothetical protein